MPWHIEEDNPDCSGYAVVQDNNGNVMGCHTTREAAQRQVAALYASEADKEKQMTRLNKTYEVESFKALPGEDGAGRFEAIVSVFGNVDFQGDVVMPGAFKGSIDRWREKGDPVPVIWSHDWANPHAHIGYVDPAEVEEIFAEGKERKGPAGLKVAGQLDLDNPFAAQVYRLLKERRVKEFSFAYDVIREKKGRDRENQLHELDIIEVGPTLKGANPSTELLGVKSQLEEAAKEAHDAGFDQENAARERILEKAKLAMGARSYDEPQIPEEWKDLLDAAAGTKNASNQSGGSLEEEQEQRRGDSEEAIEEMAKAEETTEVKSDVSPVTIEAAENLKAALDQFINSFKSEDPDEEVTEPDTDDTDDDEEEEVAAESEPKADPDAEIKARLADLEAITGLSGL